MINQKTQGMYYTLRFVHNETELWNFKGLYLNRLYFLT